MRRRHRCSRNPALTQVPPASVLTVHDVPNIYHVPLILAAQGAPLIISQRLGLSLTHQPELHRWRTLAESVDVFNSEGHNQARGDVRIRM